MSNFEIHELTEKAINRNSNIIHDTLYGEDYETGKNLAGAVADLASANVAAPYDTTVTYAIGQYCLYEGNIYRCIAITTGAFDSTAWVQIVVTGEYRRVVELTSAQYSALTSAEQNNGTIYVKTDEETTAADIPYSSGVSVADKLDAIPSFNTVDFSSQINWNSSVTVQIIAAYRVLNICIISIAIRASGLLGELAVLPHVPNAKYFGRIQDNNGGASPVPYITAYEENGVGKLGVDVAASGAGLLIGEIVYFI